MSSAAAANTKDETLRDVGVEPEHDTDAMAQELPAPSPLHEEPPRVVFHVTGFGKFCGVPDNPTTHLMQVLPELVPKRQEGGEIRDGPRGEASSAAADEGRKASFELGSCLVLDVSVKEGGRQVRELHARVRAGRCKGGSGEGGEDAESAESSRDAGGEVTGANACADDTPGMDTYNSGNGDITVFVHCGVNAGGDAFLLETRGYNEASFGVPDEQGFWPTAAPIEPNNPDTGHVRVTTLPIADVLERLGQRGWGSDLVRESTDAGRFVCNFVYYSSLGLCEEACRRAAGSEDTQSADGAAASRNQHCLFLHVPLFAVISEERQQAFVVDCLACIAASLIDQCRSPPHFNSKIAPTATQATLRDERDSTTSTVDERSAAASNKLQPASPPESERSPTTANGVMHSATPDESKTTSVFHPHGQTSIWDGPSDQAQPSAAPSSQNIANIVADHAAPHVSAHTAKEVFNNFRERRADRESEWMATRRKLVDAGFNVLDVDAAMATTESSSHEVNLRFLFEVSSLLPDGAPTKMTADSLLSSGNDTLADDLNEGTKRRSVSASSAGTSVGASVGGMSPQSALQGTTSSSSVSPRILCSASSSPGRSAATSQVGKGVGLMSRLRRRKKHPMEADTTADAVAVSAGTGLSGPPQPPSPEYSRRTTGNSHSLSPPPKGRRVAAGETRAVTWRTEASAGWGSGSRGDFDLRLALLVRVDVGMGPGAMAAQCCRAALAASRKAEASWNANNLAVWRDSGEAAVVLAAKDARTLDSVLQVAAASNVPITMVRDKNAGWTTDVRAHDCSVAALGPASTSALFNVAGTIPVL